ncbi:MAG TPA: ATP-binding protein [Candidatus Paceibacterota bacterium]
MSDWQTTSLFIVSGLNALFSLILIREGKSRVNIIFSLFVLAASAWALGIGLFRTINDINYSLYIANFYYVAAALIPLLFLYFSLVFLNDKKRIGILYLWLGLPMIALLAGLVINRNLILLSVSSLSGVKTATINLIPYSIYGILFVLYVITSFFVLFRSLSHAQEREQKIQIRFVIYGTIIPYILGMVFNLILPWIGNYQHIWLGPIFSIMMVAAVGYAVANHHLFNLKIIATEVTVVVLWIFLLVRTLVSSGVTDQIINGSTFIALVILGVLLIRSVIKEVKTRERMEALAKELASANERLTVLDRQKSEFLSIASHQLRSPLTAIKGYSSMILEGSFGVPEAKMKEAIERIYLSSERLVIIIEDFLNVSRIEQGRMQYDFATVNLEELVTGVTQELEPNIKRARLDISFSKKTAGPFYINADFGKIRQVITNIIDNAVKYTPEGGITVSLSKDEETRKILLAISDTGIGIAREVLPMLFQKFTRAKGASEVNTQGTGLGLYVVKELMKAHKGSVWVDSPGEGKGSTFYLEFMAE